MTLEKMHRDLVQISDGRVIDRTTMMIVQADKCHAEWRRSFHRSFVDVTCWHPDKPEICRVNNRTALNLWKAPQAMPVPHDSQALANIFDQHINWIVPVDKRRRFKQWLGHMVQRPHERPATCYLFKGMPGTGRRTLFKMIANAIGADHSAIDTNENEYETRLSQKLFASGHNVRADGGRISYWKKTVTEETRKYHRHYVEANCTRFVFLDVRPFDNHNADHSRQLITIETPNAIDPQWSKQWFDGIYRMIDSQSFAASIRYWLMTLDLSGFDYTADAPLPLPAPKTPKPRKPKAPRSEATKAWSHGYADKRRKVLDGPRIALLAPPSAPDPDGLDLPASG